LICANKDDYGERAPRRYFARFTVTAFSVCFTSNRDDAFNRSRSFEYP
jgi:hypothetical protein